MVNFDGNALSGLEAQYDTAVKQLLAQKIVLAWVLQRVVREFEGMSCEAIIPCIEDHPMISRIPLEEGLSNTKIRGEATESNINGEGVIYYDIRFRAKVPWKEDIVELLINLEAQKKYNPGYEIITRAIFYCARMLSAQKTVDFVQSHYDDIKKVYSIWICMNSPAYIGNAIARYHLTKEDVIPGIPDKKYAYDKLETVIITLNESETEDVFLKKMNILLSADLNREAKLRQLTAYDVTVDQHMEEAMIAMCNLGSDIAEKNLQRGIQLGIQNGLQQGIRQQLKNSYYRLRQKQHSRADAFELLDMPEDIQKELIAEEKAAKI